MTTLNVEAIKAIQEMALEAAGKTVELDGVAYSTTKLHDPRKPASEASKLGVHTLTGLVGYIQENRDGLELSKLTVHVVDPTTVRVRSALEGDFRQRELYLEATAQDLAEGFLGKFRPQESFVIGLQTRFVTELPDNLAAVLQLAGNLQAEAVETNTDDGISQTVTTRQGIGTLEKAAVPNPVRLSAFRTFREVEQPRALYVLRIRDGAELALFEADGGAWRDEAIARVAAWLREQLPDGVALIA